MELYNCLVERGKCEMGFFDSHSHLNDEKFEQVFLKILDEHKGDKIKKHYEKLKPEYS